MSSTGATLESRSRQRFPRATFLRAFTLNRYLLVEIFPPLSMGLFVVTCSLLLIMILDVMDELFLSGAPLWPILKVLICVLPSLLTMALPIGCLLSSMLVYGRLAEDRELMAMRAGGMSSASLLAPAYFLGALLTLFNLYWTSQITPKSVNILKGATQEIVEDMTNISFIKPGQFNTPMPNMAVYVTGMPPGKNTLERVMIFTSGAEGGFNWFGNSSNESQAVNWTVSAPTATLIPRPDLGVLKMTLSDCVAEDLSNPAQLSRVGVDTATITIDISRRIAKMTGGGLTKETESVGYYLQQAATAEANFQRLVAHMRVPKETPVEDFDRVVKGLVDKQRSDPTPHKEILEEAESLIEQSIADARFLERERPFVTLVELELIEKRLKAVQTNYNRAAQRVSYPVATFLFMMIGSALGVLMGRGKKTLCILLTVAVLLIYYSLEKTAETISEWVSLTSHFDPGFIIWTPHMLLFAVGLILHRLVNRF